MKVFIDSDATMTVIEETPFGQREKLFISIDDANSLLDKRARAHYLPNGEEVRIVDTKKDSKDSILEEIVNILDGIPETIDVRLRIKELLYK